MEILNKMFGTKTGISRIIYVFFICLIFNILAGYLFYLQNNIGLYLDTLKSKFEIMVFVRTGEKAPEVLGEKIRALKETKTMNFISKEQAKKKMENFRHEVFLTDGNPFPDSFLIKPEIINNTEIENFCSKLRSYSNVDEVKYDINLLKSIMAFSMFTKYNGMLIKYIFILLCIVFLTIVISHIQKIKVAIVKNLTLYIHVAVGLVSSAIFMMLVVFAAHILRKGFVQPEMLSFLSAVQITILVCSNIMISAVSVLLYETVNFS